MKKEHLDKLNKVYDEVFKVQHSVEWGLFGLRPKSLRENRIDKLEKKVDLLLDHFNLRLVEEPKKEVLKKKSKK